MILTNLQAEKVDEIVRHFSEGVREVQFKSPTGSGKTLQAANIISRIINDNPSENFVFIIATISNSELPQSFESKINEYKGELPTSDFEVEYIESPSSNKSNKSDSVPQIKLIRNKVYIFGKASFGAGRIFTEQEVFSDFINECKTQNYKLIYVRDEAHIGTKSQKTDSGVVNFEKLMKENADFLLSMTATLEHRPGVAIVELKEKDLCDETKNEGKWLIKRTPVTINDQSLTDEDLLENAISEFQLIQENYRKLNFQIRPAMLIQVDNEPTDKDKKVEFQKSLDLIKKQLSDKNISWVQYFGDKDKDNNTVDNNNFSLNKITRNNDTTDCIIFKIGPATGWDIPRACMLLQLRNVCSSNLNVQTIGRIKRNPYPKLEKNDITDKYYIFTNAPKDSKKEYIVFDYKLRDTYKNEEFAVIKVEKSKNEKIKIAALQEEVKLFLKQKENELKVQINECFTDGIYFEREKKLIIKSPILLLKRIKYLTDNLNKFQVQVIDEIEKQSDSKFSWETLQIVLLVYFQKEITAIYKKCLPISEKYKIEFEILNPKVYKEIYDEDYQASIDVSGQSYLFDIEENGKTIEMQPLDSENENDVGEIITNFAEDFAGKVKVWCKNQTTSNVYAEYINETLDTRKSYFDYIVKFTNGNYLYLEVKGDDQSDIDKEKTKLLQESYENFFSKTVETELFKHKIVLCVVKVGEDRVTPYPFYDKKKISEDLNGLKLRKIMQLLAE